MEETDFVSPKLTKSETTQKLKSHPSSSTRGGGSKNTRKHHPTPSAAGEGGSNNTRKHHPTPPAAGEGGEGGSETITNSRPQEKAVPTILESTTQLPPPQEKAVPTILESTTQLPPPQEKAVPVILETITKLPRPQEKAVPTILESTTQLPAAGEGGSKILESTTQLPPPQEKAVPVILETITKLPRPQEKAVPTILESTTHSPRFLETAAGQVAFRLLCHDHTAGGVIGSSGSIIKHLETLTGSKIRFEESIPNCHERVINIVGDAVVGRTISVGTSEEYEMVDVSKAQEGLMRVFERVLEVEGNAGNNGNEDNKHNSNGLISCRLLAQKGQIGGLIGKRGKILDGIRKSSGQRFGFLRRSRFLLVQALKRS
ncbi:hypothetical protein Sango_1865300 [Sesamum angolense]|uniref:K Homology domain-containing protein n=1 Tax=Sesamum angolense TaxID=2727404 RepID=A0AAE1WID6_9LAMI|nr:hypothetical protein Sango_1865300 [Sesamum angolense]